MSAAFFDLQCDGGCSFLGRVACLQCSGSWHYGARARCSNSNNWDISKKMKKARRMLRLLLVSLRKSRRVCSKFRRGWLGAALSVIRLSGVRDYASTTHMGRRTSGLARGASFAPQSSIAAIGHVAMAMADYGLRQGLRPKPKGLTHHLGDL